MIAQSRPLGPPLGCGCTIDCGVAAMGARAGVVGYGAGVGVRGGIPIPPIPGVSGINRIGCGSAPGVIGGGASRRVGTVETTGALAREGDDWARRASANARAVGQR